MSEKNEQKPKGRRKKAPGSTEPVLPLVAIKEEDITQSEIIPIGVPSPAPKVEIELLDNIKDLDVARKMLKIYQSANDRGLAFDLSFNTVKRLMSYKKCYYTGKEFKEDGPFGRSFDRVDSSKGYIEGNVVACTVDINGKKSNLSNDEIILLYEKLILRK